MTEGWSSAISPFHAGEQAVQERLGVRDRVEKLGRRVVRDYMPAEHRDFYSALPFLMLGTVDGEGRPWASLVPGRPGFITAPDARTLAVNAQPLFGDPLNGTLAEGAEIGVLGIEPATRRRNRMSGRVARHGPEGFAITVAQAFGNCPQYIQTRDIEVLPEVDAPEAPHPIHRSDHFDRAARALIERSDTLFIATSHGEAEHGGGADVSHRGGKPGFVRVEDERTFVFPDFRGNNHYNTIGNLVLNPKAGFLFAEFDRGDLLYMAGEARVLWEGDQVDAYQGAQRLLRFRATEVIRVEASLPLRFTFGEYSPVLQKTGSWGESAPA